MKTHTRLLGNKLTGPWATALLDELVVGHLLTLVGGEEPLGRRGRKGDPDAKRKQETARDNQEGVSPMFLGDLLKHLAWSRLLTKERKPEQVLIYHEWETCNPQVRGAGHR